MSGKLLAAAVVTGLLGAALFSQPAQANPFVVPVTGHNLTCNGGCACPNYTTNADGPGTVTFSDGGVYFNPGKHTLGCGGNSIHGAGGCAEGSCIDYTTHFCLTGLCPTNATLTGCYAVDNNFEGILLNSTRFCCFNSVVDCSAANFGCAHPFSIPAGDGFVCGPNTITFITQNTGGPGGFLAFNLVGTANPTGGGGAAPELNATEAGSALALVGAALTILMERRRKA